MSRLVEACPSIWPAKTVCCSWGAESGMHGCRLLPGHKGRCICACNRKKPERKREQADG